MSIFSTVADIVKNGADKIKAYHGSPHDFDKFSSEHIGSGEGAQAFGRGLYFAQREGTAKSYRDALTTPKFTFDGKPADAIYTNEIRERWSNIYDELVDDEMISQWKLNYLDSVAENGGNYDKASEELDLLVEKVLKGEETTYDFDKLDEFGSEIDINEVYDLTEAQRHLDSVLANMSQADTPTNMQYVIDGFSPDEKRIYDRFVAPKVEFIKPEGKMYEVNIDASVDELLDYDVKLKDQPKEVQEKIFRAFDNDLKGSITENDKKLVDELFESEELDELLQGLPSLKQQLLDSNGAQIMDMIKSHDPIKQSNVLQNSGLKGIKYADAQTRFSPKGKTHNYVIFDDKLIEISRKYGIPPVMATAVLAGTLTPEQAQAQTESTARQNMTRKQRRDNPPSELLRNYEQGKILPTLQNMGVGLVEGAADTLDILNPVNLSLNVLNPQNKGAMRFLNPAYTPSRDAIKPLSDMRFYDQTDPDSEQARKNARMAGALFSPI